AAAIRSQMQARQVQIDTGESTGPNGQKRLLNASEIAKLKQSIAKGTVLLRNFRVAIVGVAGTILMVATQIASMVPTLPVPVRGALGAVSLALNIAFNVAMPIVTYVKAIAVSQALGRNFLKAVSLLATAEYVTVQRGAVVGAVIGVGLIWGFFIYNAATSGLAVGSPQLNRAAAEAIAATLVAVLFAVLAFNPIGAIIAAIVGVIDFLLNLIC